MMGLDELDPSGGLRKRVIPMSCQGEIMADKEQIARLKALPFEEVEVYIPPAQREGVEAERRDNLPTQNRGRVRAGPIVGGQTYSVTTKELPSQLYVLRLKRRHTNLLRQYSRSKKEKDLQNRFFRKS